MQEHLNLMIHLRNAGSARRLVSILLLLAGLSGAAMASEPPSSFEVILRPESDQSGKVVSLFVEERVVSTGAPRRLSLTAPLSFIGMIPFGSQVSDLVMADDEGPLTLTIADDASSPDGPTRSWRSDRPVAGRAIVRYRLPMQPMGRGGPPYGVKAGALGLGGNTSSVLLMPDTPNVQVSRLSWDLSQLEAGSLGVATGGSGTLIVNGPAESLLDRWFLAGPLHPGQAHTQHGFNAFTLGTPPFDSTAMMRWSRSVYAALAEGFGYLGQPQYELLIRTLDAPSFTTGTARNAGGGSLITTGSPTFSRGQGEADVRNTIAHEMGHQWVGQFADGGSLWFAEGLNVYITSTLPCEVGLQDWSECAAQISKWARAYYASEGRTWSQAKIEAAPFEREDLRLVSYGRGMMFFANLDASIRTASRGKRTLLVALRPLFEARKGGRPITMAVWEAWLREAGGSEAVTEFRRTVLLGELIVPVPGAFSPTLQATQKRYHEAAESATGYEWRPF